MWGCSIVGEKSWYFVLQSVLLHLGLLASIAGVSLHWPASGSETRSVGVGPGPLFASVVLLERLPVSLKLGKLGKLGKLRELPESKNKSVKIAPRVSAEKSTNDRVHPHSSADGISPTVTNSLPNNSGFLYRAAAVYPRLSERKGEEGRALLEFQILRNGRPSRVKIIQSSGFSRLDRAAISAVLKSRYRAHLERRPIHQRLAYRFELTGK